MKKSGAFSVVELLVVVCVVIVFAAILLPVFRKGMANAQQVQCANNLRQLAEGWLTLQADGGSARFRTKSRTSDYWDWVAALEPYLHEKGIEALILCPSAKNANPQTTADTTGTASTAWRHHGFSGSYGFNACLYSNMGDYGWPSSRMIKAKSIGEVYPIVADSAWVDMGPSDFRLPNDFRIGNRWIVARHREKGVNVAFSDGSVRFNSVGELVRDLKLFPEDSVPRAALYQQIPGSYR